MNIDPGIWPSLSALLDEYLDQREESRAAWLDGLEPEYADLLPMLRELVSKGAARDDRFLSTLPAVTGRTAVTGYAPPASGSLVGPYRLIRELGRGGMSIVWLAERADGLLKRKVALKLPTLLVDNGTLAERFARERDILADLTHPQIARLYDAGITASGQPYLALEYVEGEPITRHCNHHGLDLRTRLALFLPVLRAVEYAHHHGIVHRDLKPSNILVTGEGEISLLDFGIAKLLVEGEALETELTRAGGHVLTPEYASPEQLAGLSVNKASDVYSLGLVLFELLTGERAKKHSREASPVRPSEAVAGSGRPASAAPAASAVSAYETNAHARGMDRKRLAAALKGDLDTIVLRALRETPSERYPTPGELARDIDRYLAGVPVLATPPTRHYRALKFVRRNRKVVFAAAGVVVALGLALSVAFRESARARRAEVVAARAPVSTRLPGRSLPVPQDGWVGTLSPGAASVSASGPSDALHAVRVRGADLEHHDFVNESTHGYFDAIGSYRRLINYDVASNDFRPVRIEADVRVRGPLSPPENNFFSASIGALAAITVDSDGNVSSADGVGELSISSDGQVHGYCGCNLVPRFQVSAPMTLDAYHKLAIDVDFRQRTYTFVVDGASLGTPFPFPDDVKTSVLVRASLIAYAAPDTATLKKRDYMAYYNNFSITNR